MRIFSYIHQGGPIMYVLLALNIIGVATILYKFFTISKAKKNTGMIASDLEQALKATVQNKDPASKSSLIKQEISYRMAELEKGLNTIKIVSGVSPLLGLLGTVVGVLVAFKVMSETGLSNPSSFAEGISMALLTTVGGLVVAIPHYIAHNYLLGMLDEIEVSLEKSVSAKIL